MRSLLSRSLALLSAVIVATAALAAASSDSPSSPGRLVDQKEVAAADITVFPDGSGLPSGRATAREGREIFNQRCAACHGERGQGSDDFHALAGGVGTLSSGQPQLTVGSYWPYATTLWDYTRRAMPYTQPGSLTATEVYAVTAYVLYLNGILAEDAVVDQTTLPAIRMPNRNGFIRDPRPRRH